uniref:Tectonin beta-propeller repeat-containing protein 2 n=1 Tax=Syphacia muris TaxID=451379 RepID=A0A0N5AJN4_9BILA
MDINGALPKLKQAEIYTDAATQKEIELNAENEKGDLQKLDSEAILLETSKPRHLKPGNEQEKSECKIMNHFEEGSSACNVNDEPFRVFTECPGLLKEIPETLFFGTTRVELNCFDVSSNYFVFGSSCGAVFVYNRRLNRSATPLRTNYDEVIMCVRLFVGSSDMLAIGHESGILVLLRFPSISNPFRRKLQQHLNQKLHGGHAITSIEWDETGTCVYSADRSGAIYATTVDFDNEVFESKKIFDDASEIVQISYVLNYLAVNTRTEAFVLNLKKNNEKVELKQFQEIGNSGVISICLFDLTPAVFLFVGSGEGGVYEYDVTTGNLLQSINLHEQVGLFNKLMNKKVGCHICRYGQNLFYYCSPYLMLLSIDDRFELLSKYFVKDLEVEQLVVENTSDLAIYLLAKDKKVFRISSTDAPQSFNVVSEQPKEFDPLSLFTSIQRTTKLLPLAPTKAIFDRLRVNGDQALSSLPNKALPIIVNALPYAANIMKSSSDCSSHTSNKNTSDDKHKDDCKKKMTQSLMSKQGWLQNVNEVSKYVVNVVGGAGIPIHEGFLPNEDPSSEYEKSLEEVQGSVDEVLVQRSKKAICKRKPTDGLQSTSSLETNSGTSEYSSFIDDAFLDNIRQTLSRVCEETLTTTETEQTESFQDMNAITVPKSEGTKEQFLIPSESSLEEQQKEPTVENESQDISFGDKNILRKAADTALPENNAYEDLVKKALENKPGKFKAVHEDIQFFDGDFNDAVSIFSDKGDIWTSEVAVWALQCDTGRLVVRAGLKYSPFGIDWVEIEPEGPSRLVNVHLFEQTGWGIDSNYCVWFTNGVDFNSPFGTSGIWLQVCSPWTILPEITRSWHVTANIKVSSFGVFVNIGRKVYWTSSKSPITGHSFKSIVPEKFSCDDFFELISAGSLDMGNTDFISLCRKNELYLFRLKTRNFNSLPSIPSFATKSIEQICAVGNTLYVLDNSGCIYVKSSIRKVYPFGDDWRLVDTGQCDSPIKSFAVSACSIWVVTVDNCVYVHSRSEVVEPCLGAKVCWNHIKFYSHSIDQIRSSRCGTYVWVYSSCSGRAWVRSSVSSRFPTGKTWLEACPEVNIAELAVGSQIVWSLSSSGQLYKLRGLTVSNPGGVYWKPVPRKLKAISLDARDNLWGLDIDGRLIYHKVEIYPSSFDRTPKSLQKLLSAEENDGDFLVV